jgi:hypothetical protein
MVTKAIEMMMMMMMKETIIARTQTSETPTLSALSSHSCSYDWRIISG